MAARAGITVLEALDKQEVFDSVRARGERLVAGLRKLQAKHPVIKAVRGLGLLVGAEVGPDVEALVGKAREQGLVINSAGGNTLRFAPPLIVTDAHVDDALERLDRALG